MKRILVLVCVGVWSMANAADRPPVIDMHMHALAADAQGPPPMAMCTPMKFPAWDQTIPYEAVFMDMLKRPTCDDPVWSPETEEELLSQTLGAMERRNIVGVLSGTPDRVAEWMSASPDRFLPGIGFQIGREPRCSFGLTCLILA